MIECEFYRAGNCKKAEQLAGIPVPTYEPSCIACLAGNANVPRGLAIVELAKHGRSLANTEIAPTEGPGTELKKLISWFWWPSKRCEQCANRVLKMNKWGAEKCRKRRSLIIRWLHQSADQHGLPFSELAAGAMVDMAIASSEKKARSAVSPARQEQPKTYTAVWVYWKGGAQSDELDYSIRSAIANLRDLRNVVVCGDHPGDWYTGDFIESKRFNKQDGIDRFGSGRFVKWIDSAIKLQKIIESDLVTDSFLWMYDDTFFVKPWSIEQTAILRAGGDLWDLQSLRDPVRQTWREVMRRTAASLVERGLPQRNYSTHYPVVYQKRLLAETIKEFDLLNCARLVESVYLNHHFSNPLPAHEVFQYSKKIKSGWSIHQHVSVVNVGGFNEHAQKVIKTMFPLPMPMPTTSFTEGQ